MKLVSFFLTFLIPVSISQAQTEAQKNLIGSALDNYSKVAGAWHLNVQCQFYQNENLANFREDVAIITRALHTELGNSNILLQIQASAKKVASQEKFKACEEDAKGVVDWGVRYSGIWSDEIIKIQAEQQRQ